MKHRGACSTKLVRWIGFVVGLLFVYAAFRFGPDLMAFYRGGFFDKSAVRKYEGTSLDNLKALHTALMLYHDSEGQFPHASGWMDAVKPRLRTADLAPEEAEKKLRHPYVSAADSGKFGYAMNDAASAKYKDDVPGGDSTVLVFDSADTNYNAHGDPLTMAANPERPGGNLSITIGGALLRSGKPVEGAKK